MRYVAWAGDKLAEIVDGSYRVYFRLWPPAELRWVDGEERAHATIVEPTAPLLEREFWQRTKAVEFAKEGWSISEDAWRQA